MDRFAGFWAVFAVAALIAVLVPRVLDDRGRLEIGPGKVRVEEPAIRTTSGGAREVRVPLSMGGAYLTEVTVEGARVDVLIDTGASYFTLRESDAAKAGIIPRPRDYRYEFSTANGKVNAARAEVETLDLGPGRIEGVTVFVLPDDRLDISLLGMNVLRRFGSVSFERDGLLTITVD